MYTEWWMEIHRDTDKGVLDILFISFSEEDY